MVVALAPLHRAARIKRVVVSTYQAVSGTGRAAIEELRNQVNDFAAGNGVRVNKDIYPHQIAFNLFPHISGMKDIFPGYTGEEIKMIRETRKILDAPDMAVSATCVRVPILNGHSESVNVEFEKPLSADEAREILRASEGIVLMDDIANAVYPTPLAASGTDPVYVGRIRQDSCNPNTLDFFCASDNIRKGAALNAVQNAEKMIEMGLL
jgi:aspartate-semialdehyde dehydrogenase